MRRLLAAGGCVAALALVLAAPALGDTVQITVHGTSFSGTITNTGTKAHNFISIGTEAGKANPVESFQIQGGKNIQPYATYGSYFGNVMIKPGETVSFHGTTKKPTTAFNMPTSDDGGMDNADNHVTATSGSKPPPTKPTPPPNPGPGGVGSSSSAGSSDLWIWVVVGVIGFILGCVALWWVLTHYFEDDDDDDEPVGGLRALFQNLLQSGSGSVATPPAGTLAEAPPRDPGPDPNDPFQDEDGPIPNAEWNDDATAPTPAPVDDPLKDVTTGDSATAESGPPPEIANLFDDEAPVPTTDTVPATGDSSGPDPEVVP